MEKEKKSQLCRVPTSSCQVPKNDGKGNEKGNQYDPIPGYDVTDFEENRESYIYVTSGIKRKKKKKKRNERKPLATRDDRVRR